MKFIKPILSMVLILSFLCCLIPSYALTAQSSVGILPENPAEGARGWGFIDAIGGVELHDQPALREIGGELSEILLEKESGVLPEQPGNISGYGSLSTPLVQPPDMTVYDVAGFAEPQRMEKYAERKVSSAYEIAEYVMCSIMSGEESWVQGGGLINSGYAVTFEPNTNTITEMALRNILSETAMFIYAYFPHHHHMIYTFVSDAENYYTVT
ncbi:MAG: hypothetical protein FWH24_03050, partial [Oscillospiraceae bacterium]|nr:hypothetical protein [Oscillospiraceae bacterium]